KLTNAVCGSLNESWYLIHTCRLQAVNRYRTTFNFNGTILHPAYNIEIDAQLLKKENGYKPFLYKIRFDLCRFFKKPFNPLVIIVYKAVRDFINFNHTCPYVGPQIVNGFYISYELLQVPWPTGEFLLKMDWFFDQKPQFFTNMYFAVKE
ncbi:hypothetical protein KR222_009060, partial [Zaprionus bogoriensis]